MKRLLGWLEDRFIWLLDRMISGVDALTEWVAARGGRVGPPRAKVELTEGVVTCSRCDWELVGPPRTLEVAYMLHVKREHAR